jgi:hypothetical protein
MTQPSPWDYGPHEITSHADFWYRRHKETGEVQWYDDATHEWMTVPADRWPYGEQP